MLLLSCYRSQTEAGQYHSSLCEINELTDFEHDCFRPATGQDNARCGVQANRPVASLGLYSNALSPVRQGPTRTPDRTAESYPTPRHRRTLRARRRANPPGEHRSTREPHRGDSGVRDDGGSRPTNTGTGRKPKTRFYGGFTRKCKGAVSGRSSILLPSSVPMCYPRATAARTIFVGCNSNAASVPGGSCSFFCDATCLVCFPIEKRSVNDKTSFERAVRIPLWRMG